MDEAEENSAFVGDVRWESPNVLWISAKPLASVVAASEDDHVEANSVRRRDREVGRGASPERRIENLQQVGSGDTDMIKPLPRERLIGRDTAGDEATHPGTSHKEGPGRITGSSHLGDLVGRQAHAAECVAGSRGAPRGEGSCGPSRKPC